ncbi:MAG TPA: MmgE/PrpD family protein [Burkholderiales bacterium]|nr:MmgE/PrpD family protein [Burkholderiales bacterium]
MAETIAERLATWSSGVSLERLPGEVVASAKRCIVDASGVGIAGANYPVARAVRKLVREAGATGAASLWGTDEQALAPEAAAHCNAVAAHALDFDDTCYDGIVHGSAAVWPAVLACGEATGASGARLLEAFVAGVECEYALGRAFGDELYFKGWWTSGLLGSIGAAAGAAKVLGLDAVRTRSAIALAACHGGGVRAVIGSDAKPFMIGRAAAAGVQAARYAAAGLEAPADAFESHRGFIPVLADGRFDQSRLALGERYSLVEPGVAFKLFPACSATQAATEAVLDLARDHHIDAADVERVDCRVTKLVFISLTYDRPASVTEAQFSLTYAIACALRYRAFGVEHLSSPTFGEPRMLATMAKVRMTQSETLEATEEGRRRNPEGAHVTIHLKDGRSFERYNGAATGMPQKPMPDAALDAKFLACAGASLGSATAERLLRTLRALESSPGPVSLGRASSGTSRRT